MEGTEDLLVRPTSGAEEAAAKAHNGEEAGSSVSPMPSGAGVGDLPADLGPAYQKLLAEKQELYDRLLRKQAELENYRKRVQREKEEFLQHATADLIRALLPVLDGFERALNHRDAALPEQIYGGMELIFRELTDVLRRAGLTPIETSGQLFDPYYHQAVEVVESPSHRDQEIVEELQRGYKLRHRLLRPAIVKVAVASRPQGSTTGSDAGPQSQPVS